MKPLLHLMLGMMLTLVVFTTRARAEPDSCVMGAFTLPLLGGPGDAPVLPATMQGKPVAFYYSTTVDGLYGGDIMSYGGNDTGRRVRIVQDGGGGDDAPLIQTGPLKMGDLDLGTPSMIRLTQFPSRSVDGRPVIGVIGARQFERLAVLVDLPRGVFALIRFGNDKACENAATMLVGPGETIFPLDTQHHAEITLNGVKRSLALDPNTPFNILPASWVAGHNGQAEHGGSVPRLGAAATHDEMTLLSAPPGLAGTTFHLQGSPGLDASNQDTATGVLGLAFFERHIVLFDYPNHTVHILVSRHQRSGAGDTLRFPHTLRNEGQALVIRPVSGTWPLTPIYAGAGIQPGLN